MFVRSDHPRVVKVTVSELAAQVANSEQNDGTHCVLANCVKARFPGHEVFVSASGAVKVSGPLSTLVAAATPQTRQIVSDFDVDGSVCLDQADLTLRFEEYIQD